MDPRITPHEKHERGEAPKSLGACRKAKPTSDGEAVPIITSVVLQRGRRAVETRVIDNAEYSADNDQ